MSKTYEIKTLSDFFNVPSDRIDDCLKEFALGIKVMKSDFEALGVPNGKMDFFNWTDDGKQNLKADYKLDAENVVRREIEDHVCSIEAMLEAQEQGK
jgi:hypothetical protein